MAQLSNNVGKTNLTSDTALQSSARCTNICNALFIIQWLRPIQQLKVEVYTSIKYTLVSYVASHQTIHAELFM